MSIAGFDPSGGAGILADIKTIEANGGYGLGVLSANTFQNDIAFEKTEWIPVETIKEQLTVLFKRFQTHHYKIGLIESLEVLEELVVFIKAHHAAAVITWDPILKASAGFSFHDCIDKRRLQAVMKQISVITPNIPEAEQLFGEGAALHQQLLENSEYCAIYLKGGHATEVMATDTLYAEHTTYTYQQPRIAYGEKHGSGCVLSAALATQLALGKDLPTAAENAGRYTHLFLSSNQTLLGYHQYPVHHETNQ